MNATYDTDFYTWTREQASVLRRAAELRLNAPEGVDWLNLAEEIEDLGKSKVDELYSRYVVLWVHLLKWSFQPEAQSSSWRGSVVEQRSRLTRLVRNNPGLKPLRDAEFNEAYAEARKLASFETGQFLGAFPVDPPFTRAQAEDEAFWPEPSVDRGTGERA